MSRPKKTEMVGFRVIAEEKAYLEREADERNLNLSEYLRALALPAGIAIIADDKK